MLKTLFSIILLCSIIFLTALPEISFGELEHDFGTFKEEDGEVIHKFEFTNTGDEPLKLELVKAS